MARSIGADPHIIIPTATYIAVGKGAIAFVSWPFERMREAMRRLN
jgi:hypothetical protein